MATVLARNWWAIALRGVAAIVFGVLALAMPGVTLVALIYLFGAYALVDGVLAVVAAVRGHTGPRRWWAVLLEGLVDIAAGLVAFFMPGLTALVMTLLIGFWAIITGAAEIAAAVRLREHIQGEWMLGLAGALSIVFGIGAIVLPQIGALAIVLWIGAYAIVFGALLVGLGLRLRRHRDEEVAWPAARAA